MRNKRKNNENTIRKTMKNLSVYIYINDAVKKELMRENPIHGVKLRGCRESDIEALTEEELKRLTEIYTEGRLNNSTSCCRPKEDRSALIRFLESI
jgi:hypothetical protein